MDIWSTFDRRLLVEVVRVAESNGLKLPREFALLVKQAGSWSQCRRSWSQLIAAVRDRFSSECFRSAWWLLWLPMRRRSNMKQCEAMKESERIWKTMTRSSDLRIFGRPYTLIATPKFWLQQGAQWYQEETRTYKDQFSFWFCFEMAMNTMDWMNGHGQNTLKTTMSPFSFFFYVIPLSYLWLTW